jgi:hypothetical protein
MHGHPAAAAVRDAAEAVCQGARRGPAGCCTTGPHPTRRSSWTPACSWHSFHPTFCLQQYTPPPPLPPCLSTPSPLPPPPPQAQPPRPTSSCSPPSCRVRSRSLAARLLPKVRCSWRAASSSASVSDNLAVRLLTWGAGRRDGVSVCVCGGGGQWDLEWGAQQRLQLRLGACADPTHQ